MTSEAWSQPVLIVPAERMAAIAAWRPGVEEQSLKNKELMLKWLERLEVALADDQQALNQRRLDLQRLRNIINRKDETYTSGPSVEQMVADLSALRGVAHKRARPTTEMPEDQLVSLFSGSDIPALPVDRLLRLPNAPHMPSREAQPDVIGPGSMLIVNSVFYPTTIDSKKLLLSVAIVVEDAEVNPEADLLVNWFVPDYAPEASMKTGKKKLILDLFGEWTSYGELSADRARGVDIPTVLIYPKAILIYNFELVDRKLPYSVLGDLRRTHGIDVTSLSCSLTANGNLYRAAVLLDGTGTAPTG